MQLFTEKDIFGQDISMSIQLFEEELLSVVRRQRLQLGKQRYALDNYLATAIGLLSCVIPYDVADDGSSTACALRKMCREILLNTEQEAKSPFYKKAEEYIQSHPLEYQEIHTKTNLYYLALFPEWLEECIPQFLHEQSEADHRPWDLVDVRGMGHELAQLLCEDDVSRLNQLLQQRFLPQPPVSIFIAAMINDYANTLITRDLETGRYLFQLALEEML